MENQESSWSGTCSCRLNSHCPMDEFQGWGLWQRVCRPSQLMVRKNGPKFVVGNPFFVCFPVKLVQYLLKHGSLTIYVVAQHGAETDH